ncbi:MAG: DUF3013 family protein, partial [Alkalibacterium sp.]|nr:DUF3013 family protein [Alkalibacterium sp.]
NELKTMLPNFKWKIVKDSKKKLVELFLTFSVKADESVQVQDMLGKNNKPGNVQLEDVICFYDPAYSHVKPQNYLASFSMDSFAGIDKGYVDAILRKLNYTTKKGEVELNEFLNNDFTDSFTLTWQNKNLENMVDTMKKARRYSEEKLMFDPDGEESFFEKLKKDDTDDGVERI